MFAKKIFFSIIRKFLKIILLLSPYSLRIKIHYYIYFFNPQKEIELFNIQKLISKEGGAIDIGCNLGLYSYAFSKQKKIDKIYSFEPNKSHLIDLYNYDCRNIKIFNYALSSCSKIQDLIVPYFRHFELDGFATLEKNIFLNKKFKKFKKIKIKTKKLDHFSFKRISFIKIDVEGHEINLLKGAKKTFKLNKPNCLIEVKKGNLSNVKKFFKSIDNKYKCVPKKNFHFKFAKENYLFSKYL